MHFNIEKMKAVVTYFKQYTTAKCALDDKRKKKHKKFLCLVQSICTRWNTEYYMMKRFFEVRSDLAAVMVTLTNCPQLLMGNV